MRLDAGSCMLLAGSILAVSLAAHAQPPAGAPQVEGTVGTAGVSSAVQAAVAFYPPTNFLDKYMK